MRFAASLRVCVCLGFLAAPLPASAQEPSAAAVVTLADGTSLPLTGWSLSYEYQAWKEGTPQAFAQPVRRATSELLVGKKSYSTAGATLEIQYRTFPRPAEEGSDQPPPAGAVVTGLVLTAAGKKTEIKLEAPQKDSLLPLGTGKGLVAQARSLDLAGQTLTGTRREFCLVSFSAQVECGSLPSERVVKIEFQK